MHVYESTFMWEGADDGGDLVEMAAKRETNVMCQKQPFTIFKETLTRFSVIFFSRKPGILAQTWSFPNPNQVCFVSKTEQKCYMIHI